MIKLELSNKEALKLLNWLSFQAHEVDIDKESFELFKKIEKTITGKDREEHSYTIQRFYDIYKIQNEE